MIKSQKRRGILDEILNTIKDPYVYKTIDYVKKDEAYVKAFLHGPLIKKVKQLYMTHTMVREETVAEHALSSVVWEGDKKTTVHNMTLFGVMHRPDMEVNFNDMNIALEFKKGDSGQSVRDIIGQSIVYSKAYDFVISLLIDTSPRKNIVNSINGIHEQTIIKSLWDMHNIVLDFV